MLKPVRLTRTSDISIHLHTPCKINLNSIIQSPPPSSRLPIECPLPLSTTPLRRKGLSPHIHNRNTVMETSGCYIHSLAALIAGNKANGTICVKNEVGLSISLGAVEK